MKHQFLAFVKPEVELQVWWVQKKKKILFFNLIKYQYLWHTINLTSSCSAKQVRWPKSLFFL